MSRPLIYLPLEAAITPKDGDCMTKRWWVYRPGEGLVFAKIGRDHHAPQCNSNKIITESIRARLYPDHGILYVEVVYLGHLSPKEA